MLCIKRILFCLFVFILSSSVSANPTQEEVKKQWEDYYKLSKLLRRDDIKLISAEVKSRGKKTYESPTSALDFGFDQYDMTGDFFKTDEGKRIVDIILSFQTPSGGWSKQVDMTKRKRRKAEGFGRMVNFVPTFDSDATTTHLQVLAKAASAGNKDAKNAFLRGLGLIFNAQYPNGGFPQGYPLSGGYHDLITFNDGTFINILEILRLVANGQNEYSFIPNFTRKRANEAFLKGVNCILVSQVNINNQFTIWGAQHDQFDFSLKSARAYEPAALASTESADVVMFLMSLENPPDVIVLAVDDAIKWFKSAQINGYSWTLEGGLVADKNAAPLWARFYNTNNEPVFGDRNGKVYKNINEISKERRTSYRWYTNTPNEVIAKYNEWRKAFK